MGIIRVEERRINTKVIVPATEPPEQHWKTLALETGERLKRQSEKLEHLNKQADELRARNHKQGQELDKLGQRLDEQQAEIVKVTAERDDSRKELASQNAMKRAVWEMAQDVKRAIDDGVSGLLALDGSAETLTGAK